MSFLSKVKEELFIPKLKEINLLIKNSKDVPVTITIIIIKESINTKVKKLFPIKPIRLDIKSLTKLDKYFFDLNIY